MPVVTMESCQLPASELERRDSSPTATNALASNPFSAFFQVS